MKNQLPFCPYCKSRMSYLQAWGIHKDGEYRCPRCGKASNIRYTKRLRTFAAAASALGFLIAVLLVIFRQGIQFGHVLLIIVPFLFFSSKYDFSLFEETRRIDKVNNNPAVSKRRQAQRPAKRRVDPPKKPGGTEEEIDQILQDFIDE